MSGGAAQPGPGYVHCSANGLDLTDNNASVSVEEHRRSFVQRVCETVSGLVLGKYEPCILGGSNELLYEGYMLIDEKLHEQDTALALGDLDIQTYLHVHLTRYYEAHGEFEELLGGKHHCVYGVLLPAARGREPISLILRIPRSQEYFSMSERGIGVLHHIKLLAGIPIPRVIAHSFGPNTPLSPAWSLQSRCSGDNLCSDNMNYWMLHTISQARIAQELGVVYRELLSNSFLSPGELRFRDGMTRASIEPFPVYGGDPSSNHRLEDGGNMLEHPSTLEWLTSQLNRWRAAALPGDTEIQKYLVCLIKVAGQMGQMGLFALEQFTLCHLDLHPRNIIARRTSAGTPTITGIIDWDSAIIAPAFVQCTPPSWIWHYRTEFSPDNGGPPQEPFPPRPPLNNQQDTLKSIFDYAAGPEYRAFAYDDNYRLARMLFHIAANGIYNPVYMADADRLLLEWAVARDPRLPEIRA